MIFACTIYSIAVLAVLGFMIRTEHRHMCRGRESAEPDSGGKPEPLFLSPGRQDEGRMTKALYQWMADHSNSGSRACPPPIRPAREPETVATSAGSSSALEACVPDAHPTAFRQDKAAPRVSIHVESGTGDDFDPALHNFSTLVPSTNYYELLQISPNADVDTIQRVYRFMAARFHPDNPNTGDNERFLLLKQAFETLVDSVRRAEYDSANKVREAAPLPIFGRKVFLDGIEGEMNRRFGVLSLLYYRRRISGASPGLSLLELEKRMAFPREYLEFTLWYLLRKGYIAITESSSDYALTESGVDYVETRRSSSKVVRELLVAGDRAALPGSFDESAPGSHRAVRSLNRNPRRRRRLQRGSTTLEPRTAIGAVS